MVFQKGNTLWRLANHRGQRGWNKGLRKEMNASIKQQSKTLKKHWKENKHPKGMLNKKHSLETKMLMSKLRRGENNANWKGGITEVKRGIKRSPQYYWWRRAVLNRDNEICQRCGKPNSREAHHIKPFKEFPELRFDVSNGLTLCFDCHNKIHFKGGVLSNTHA